MYIHIYVYVYIYVYSYGPCVHIYIHIYIHTVCVYVHVGGRVRVHRCAHTSGNQRLMLDVLLDHSSCVLKQDLILNLEFVNSLGWPSQGVTEPACVK